jgi:hypothetical protein
LWWWKWWLLLLLLLLLLLRVDGGVRWWLQHVLRWLKDVRWRQSRVG